MLPVGRPPPAPPLGVRRHGAPLVGVPDEVDPRVGADEVAADLVAHDLGDAIPATVVEAEVTLPDAELLHGQPSSLCHGPPSTFAATALASAAANPASFECVSVPSASTTQAWTPAATR